MRGQGAESLALRSLREAYRWHQLHRSGDLPVWEAPDGLETHLAASHGALPLESSDPDDVVDFLLREVMPRPTGNSHPSFLGWGHGGGDELQMIAAIIASAMNSNTGGRNHGATHVDRTVLGWLRDIFDFGPSSSGVFTHGTSEANLLALAIARTRAHSDSTAVSEVSREVVYVGADIHDSVTKAARLLQFGHIRVVQPDRNNGGISANALEGAINRDRADGFLPVAVVASAGSIDSGACDQFDDIADVCLDQRVWMHVDGAFGAWLRIAPPPFDEPVAGIERADSLAFDLHKWLPMPFSTGVLLTKDPAAHRATFASDADYLEPGAGLAGGPDWAVNYGIALSRPFQSLAPYLILRVRGLRAIGEAIAYCIVLAHYFGDLVTQSPYLRLVSDVTGNVVLFDALSADGASIPADEVASGLQRRGETVFSTTSMNGRQVLRACFVNHGTRPRHVDQAIRELDRYVRTRESKKTG